MTTKKFDIFDIKSTSDESKVKITVGDLEATVVEYQAIVGRLYAKAARYRRVTKKHAAWEKAAGVRARINRAYREQILDANSIPSS